MQAILEYTRAIDRNPDFAEAYFSRCRMYAHQKKYAKALQDVDKVIGLRPGMTEAHRLREEIRTAMKNEEGVAVK